MIETVEYHGRVYQRYAIDNGSYFAPIDQVRPAMFRGEAVISSPFPLTQRPYKDEADRLRMMHHVFLQLFDGRLIFPPISRPRRILDCGFGSASWAVDVAETYPNCQVR